MGRTEANYPLKQFRSESRVGIGSFLLVEFTDVVCAGADLSLEREREMLGVDPAGTYCTN
jgi:hypothetical protein